MTQQAQKLTVLSQREVFISHSASDIGIARELIRLLETGLLLTGDNIFCSSLPGQGIGGGGPIADTLWKLIWSSAVVVFIITENFINSTYCMCELGAVWGAQKQFVPVIVPPIRYSDLPGVLSISRAYDISKDRDIDGIRDDIVSALPRLRKKGGFAKWNGAKDVFSIESIRLISQFSPERIAGEALVNINNIKIELRRIAQEFRNISSSDVSFFVMMLDIDRLTQINEKFKYETGNFIIKEMVNLVNKEKLFLEKGRCGDDTFFGILFGRQIDVMAFATLFTKNAGEELKKAVREVLRLDIDISVSCGLADIDVCPAARFFECAFYACHLAKMQGTGEAVLSDGKMFMNWS